MGLANLGHYYRRYRGANSLHAFALRRLTTPESIADEFFEEMGRAYTDFAEARLLAADLCGEELVDALLLGLAHGNGVHLRW